jgi:hypothetical protein
MAKEINHIFKIIGSFIAGECLSWLERLTISREYIADFALWYRNQWHGVDGVLEWD